VRDVKVTMGRLELLVTGITATLDATYACGLAALAILK
jgi:hypothetical protein